MKCNGSIDCLTETDKYDEHKTERPVIQYDLEILSRYRIPSAKIIDTFCSFLLTPWVDLFSHLLASYITTIPEKQCPQNKLIDYFLFGPIYIIGFLLFAPFGILGLLLWIILCYLPQENFSMIKVQKSSGLVDSELESEETSPEDTFTFVTANLLLAPEFIARLNNIRNTRYRTLKIAERILDHSYKHIFNVEFVENHSYIKEKRDSVLSKFPYTDFLCLQEVWERSCALTLVNLLKGEFNYFVYDVGERSMRTNFCMMGSGMMVASKRPILAVNFIPFSFRTKHARATCQGIMCLKVFLFNKGKERHVGYISNLHAQAFQGQEPVIYKQLTEARIFINMFKMHHAAAKDVVDFDVICGDFNADNMSQGDEDIQFHSLFSEYVDICVRSPGFDYDWTVGTELRQAMLHFPEMSDPDNFREILINDSARRMFVLDANVMIHNHNLVTAVVVPDATGKVRSRPWGGKRRVDKILYKADSSVTVEGYAFLSALTNLTDHLPVCMTLRSNSSVY